MTTAERGRHRYDIPRISYAQNHEDILIDRLFPDQIGSFVDIGACHPVIDSNTRFFYERGWRGVNIEPSFSSFRLFLEHRPADLNLNLAASDFNGDVTFYEVNNAGINGTSTLSTDIAERYRRQGVELAERPIPVRTIRSLINTYGIEQPDLLSIDVEGHEAAVIRGTPLDCWRPRVLIVEATLPLTTVPSHQDWEPILLAHGYVFASFNGVNRFYLREDLRGWLDRLGTPVNVLDRFVPYELMVQQEKLAVELLRHQWLEEDWARERAEWARRYSAIEQHSAHLQRQLRPYRLLDCLGVVSAGYCWARKLKHRLVS